MRLNRRLPPLLVVAALMTALVAANATHANGGFSGNVGRPTASGSDVSPLPGDFPRAHWAPIADQLLGSSLRMLIQVNGKNTHVILDTGAQSTTLSFPMAKALGIRTKGKGVKKAKVIDAHGKRMGAVRTTADNIRIGGKTFDDVEVLVVGQAPEMFVVGYTLLATFDLYIAADHGLVGFFPAGRGPHLDGEAVFSVGGTARRQMYVIGRTKDAAGNMRDLRLLVDTGASQTSIPARLGLEKNLKASVEFESRHGSVSGVQSMRGRFVLNPLFLASGGYDANMGRVLALGDPARRGFGLLGLDVINRHHTVLSPADGEIRMAKPALPDGFRTRGPNGTTCKKDGRVIPCIDVKLDALSDEEGAWLTKKAIPNLCLRAEVNKRYKGQTLEFAISAYDENNHDIFVGGALHLYVSIPNDGLSTCLSLWKQLAHLGLNKDSQISLRFVRASGFEWPCDPKFTRCLRFTGPMAKNTNVRSSERASKKSKMNAAKKK